MTPAIQFRDGTRADRDAILALRKIAFADEDREKQHADFWEWEFSDGYAGAGRFFVAEAEGRVVGHFAFVPQMYDSIRGALACDVMTDPEFRRQKVFSRLAQYAAERLRDEFPLVTAFQIRETVMGGMTAGGWRSALALPVLLKPLSLRGLARDFGLPFGSALTQTNKERSSDSIRAIDEKDFDQIDALLATPNPRQPRTAEFLLWRYKRNPHWRYELEGFFEGEKLTAFVVHRQTILKGLQTLAFAEAGCVRGSEKKLRQLIRHACGRGRRRKLAVAAALVSRHHPAYRTLLRTGFLPGPHRFRLLLQVFDERLRWLNDAPWSLSWGDTDHL